MACSLGSFTHSCGLYSPGSQITAPVLVVSTLDSPGKCEKEVRFLRMHRSNIWQQHELCVYCFQTKLGVQTWGNRSITPPVAVGPSFSHFENGWGLIMCGVHLWRIFTSLDVNCEITVPHHLEFHPFIWTNRIICEGSENRTLQTGILLLVLHLVCICFCIAVMHILSCRLWESLHNLNSALTDLRSLVVPCEHCLNRADHPTGLPRIKTNWNHISSWEPFTFFVSVGDICLFVFEDLPH